MNRLLTIVYGAASYLLFLASFVYVVGFIAGIGVPRTLDAGLQAPLMEAVVVDLLLLGLFVVPHSVMARPRFKRWWTRFVPSTIERSTYVLVSSVLLFLLCWEWRPIPDLVWHVTSPAARLALVALHWIGWVTVLASTFMISHFDLFGLRQVWLAWRGRPYTESGFRTPLLYRLVRHPLMLGFLVAFWATPAMTAGHLLFALGMTAYILVALQVEERDLVAAIGPEYRAYQSRVPMLLPWPRPRRS